MVDVGRDDGAPSRHLVSHELWRDVFGQAGTETLAGVLAQHHVRHFLTFWARGAKGFDVFFAVQVFADGDVFHLRRDDAFARVVHLRDIAAGLGATRMTVQVREAQFVEGRVQGALAAEFRRQAGELLGVVALVNPGLTQRGQPRADVDFGVRVGVGARTDRKSTRLNSSHVRISYAVFCLKKKKKQ